MYSILDALSLQYSILSVLDNWKLTIQLLQSVPFARLRVPMPSNSLTLALSTGAVVRTWCLA